MGGVFVEHAFVDAFERVDEAIPAEEADGAIVARRGPCGRRSRDW